MKQPNPKRTTQKEIDLSFFALDILSGQTANVTDRAKLYTKMKKYIEEKAQDSKTYEAAIKKAAKMCRI